MTAQTRQAGTDPILVPVLVIESGLQCDARAPITPSSQTVGHGLGCDVVLFDPTLAEAHFSLAHEPDGVLLGAIGGIISFSDGRELAPGATSLCDASVRFHAGATEFRLDIPTRPAAKASIARRWSGRTLLSGLGVGALCTALAAAGVIGAGTPSAQTAPLPPHLEAKTLSVAPIVAPVSGALKAAQTQLASAGIDSVALAKLADSSIEARGQISPNQQAAWRDVEHWFDSMYGGRAVLVEQIHVMAEPPPLVIQAVWPGHNPYVVDGGSQKLFVGAALPGGWVIESILADRVMLRRGSQALAVRF